MSSCVVLLPGFVSLCFDARKCQHFVDARLHSWASKHSLTRVCPPREFNRSLCSVCNLSDYPTKVGFRIFCRISSDYEEYARSLSDFNIFDHITLKQS